PPPPSARRRLPRRAERGRAPPRTPARTSGTGSPARSRPRSTSGSRGTSPGARSLVHLQLALPRVRLPQHGHTDALVQASRARRALRVDRQAHLAQPAGVQEREGPAEERLADAAAAPRPAHADRADPAVSRVVRALRIVERRPDDLVTVQRDEPQVGVEVAPLDGELPPLLDRLGMEVPVVLERVLQRVVYRTLVIRVPVRAQLDPIGDDRLGRRFAAEPELHRQRAPDLPVPTPRDPPGEIVPLAHGCAHASCAERAGAVLGMAERLVPDPGRRHVDVDRLALRPYVEVADDPIVAVDHD